MKKICVILSIILLISCTACNQNPGMDTTNESKEPLETINTIEEIEAFIAPQETGITFISSDSMQLDDITEKAINHYLYETGADYYIEFEYLPDRDYRNNLKKRLSSGEGCDVFSTAYPPEDYYLNNDTQLPLTSYLQSEAGKAVKDALPDYLWEALERDGEIYGVSGFYNISTSPSYMVNKKYMEKYNFTVEDLQVDVDQLHSVLRTVKEGENITPFLVPNGNLISENNSVLKANCLFVNRNTEQVTYFFDTEESSRKLQAFYEYAREGLLTSSPPIDSKMDDFFLVYQQDYLPQYQIHDGLYINEEKEFAENHRDYLLIPIDDDVYFDIIVGSATCVYRETLHPEECLDFLGRLFTDVSLTDLFYHGVEDVHYTINEDKKVAAIFDEDPHQYKDYSYSHVGSAYGNRYLSTPYDMQFVNQKDILIDLQRKAVPSDLSHMEFVFDDRITSAIKEKNLQVLKKYYDPEIYNVYVNLIDSIPYDLIGIDVILFELDAILDGQNKTSYEDIIQKVRTMLDESGADALIEEAEKVIEEFHKK